MNLIIWDIDNCIANDAWRIPFIDWTAADPYQRYMPYHRVCSGDQSHNMREFEDLHERHNADPCFITARPEAVRHMTMSWLRRHFTRSFPAANRLLMRGNDDHRASVDLKRDLLTELFAAEPEARVVLALDDRADVLTMYRQHFGIVTRLLAIHSTCAYTRPTTQPDKGH